jgi:hypothetical protein
MIGQIYDYIRIKANIVMNKYGNLFFKTEQQLVIPVAPPERDQVVKPFIQVVLPDLPLGERLPLHVELAEQLSVEVVVMDEPPPPNLLPVFDPQFENTPILPV